MQNFIELEELKEADRTWTNRDGNGKGAGKVFAQGTFVWTSTADKLEEQDENEDGKDAGVQGGDKKARRAAVGDVEAGVIGEWLGGVSFGLSVELMVIVRWVIGYSYMMECLVVGARIH